MKFTDLDFDCLENVLEYLELPDLLNVADSTKRLRKAAELVYAQKYDKRWVAFGVLEKSPAQPFLLTAREIGKIIECKDWHFSLQLLRCLGCVISRIHFDNIYFLNEHEKNTTIIKHQDQKLCTYINKYCAEYLKEMAVETTIERLRANLLELFDKPFKNMISVKLFGCNFTEKTCLIKLFPKLKNLEMDSQESFYRFNTDHFPNLKCLSIQGSFTKSNIQNEMVLPLLQLNPQLNDLSMRIIYKKLNLNLIWDAVNALQNLENLNLEINPATFIQDGNNLIHMPSLKKFKITYIVYADSRALCFLPFTFGQLETFDILFPLLQNYNYFIEQFFDFIDAHPKITCIKIFIFTNFGDVFWSRLARSLPLLIDVTIHSFRTWFSSDEAIEFIANLKMLQHFKFQFIGKRDSFQKQLGNKWEMINPIDFNYYTELKRKN